MGKPQGIYVVHWPSAMKKNFIGISRRFSIQKTRLRGKQA